MSLNDLKKPFKDDEIEWRVGQAGERADGTPWAKILAYVTARAVQDRLDDVCGPENWKNELKPWQGDSAVLCGISIKIEGEWVTKWDVSENTETESIKGGASGAEKRAAVQWGVGRYLYDLGETWANINPDGKLFGQYKTANGVRKSFRYDAPLVSKLLGKATITRGQANEFYQQVRQALSTGDENHVRALWLEWKDDEATRIKLWGLFNSEERSSMKTIGVDP